jgi:hypothetical protein
MRWLIIKKNIEVGSISRYIPTWGESLLSVNKVVSAIDRLMSARPNKKMLP